MINQSLSTGLDSWTYIDENQNVVSMLSRTIAEKAVSSKYEFLIQATDSNGKSATTQLTMNVPSKAFIKSSVLLKFLLNPLTTFERDLLAQGALTTAVEKVLKEAGAAGR